MRTKKNTRRKLPKRKPDPTHRLVGGYQKLLGKFISTAKEMDQFLPEGVRIDLANHVERIHTESLAFLAEVEDE